MKNLKFMAICLICAVGFAACGGASNGGDSAASVSESVSAPTTSQSETESQSVEIEAEPDTPVIELEDGIYSVEFDTDSSMFHVNEAMDGRGTLTVNGDELVLHIILPSKNIVNLYPGLAADAEKPGAELLEPVMDTVTYDDGMTEEVHGFDVPIPYVGPEFDLALIGTKGKWYDHRVSVSDPQMLED